MPRDTILECIRTLAQSQGFYGRLYARIVDLDADDYERAMQLLEKQNFKDVIDLVLYFES